MCGSGWWLFAGCLLCVLRCEDDLTHKLVEIVRANITLKRMMSNGSPQHILNEYISLLQVSRQCWQAVHCDTLLSCGHNGAAYQQLPRLVAPPSLAVAAEPAQW